MPPWATGYYMDNGHYNSRSLIKTEKRVQDNFSLFFLTVNCLELQEFKHWRDGGSQKINILMIFKCGAICFCKETTKDNLSSLQHNNGSCS